jgi:hypothetical protein
MPEFFLKMDPQTQAAFLSAIATFLAFLATTASVYAAFKGPAIAAKIAEQMRRDGEQASEKRRMKLHVFVILMEQRATYYTQDAVRAFNLIDIVFIDSRPVRDAWAELFASFDSAKGIPDHEKNKRYRVLMSAMAADIGIGDGLRLDDFERVYFPVALQEEDQLRFLQRRASLKQLNGDISPAANTAVTSAVANLFPPPPSD